MGVNARAFAAAVKGKATFADIRYEKDERFVLDVKDGEIRRCVSGSESGVGVRVLYGGLWGLSSTTDVTRTGVAKAVEKALRVARSAAPHAKEKITLAPVSTAPARRFWKPKKDPFDKTPQEWIQFLMDVGKTAKGEAEVNSVSTGVEMTRTETVYETSEGLRREHGLTRLLFQSDIGARRGDRMTSHRVRIGGTKGMELFSKQDPEEAVAHSAKAAVRMLSARRPPLGKVPVITDPDLTGVFAHEALGHACEADLVIAGESLLAGRIGEKFGSDEVTIVDDSSVRGAFGSIPFDAEGLPSKRKVLFERGQLAGYIHSRETAGRLGMKPNGGARAEDYSVRPLVRMSNTMIDAGDWGFEEMIKDTKRGILAMGTRGGQVDVARGTFQFSAQESFLIERGEITTPLLDVSINGLILETLARIDAVGKKVELASPGFCGKGQLVPVGDGGPYVRMSEALVGGG
ncbi:MAG: TldD/PmbA family protein [Euryarchaeota archaeon]|nr:TldD/PmbA family protein [Euryarchaeota archaeon]